MARGRHPTTPHGGLLSNDELMLSSKDLDSLCARLIRRLGEHSLNISEQSKAVGRERDSERERKRERQRQRQRERDRERQRGKVQGSEEEGDRRREGAGGRASVG
jgi:hypothetical protein